MKTALEFVEEFAEAWEIGMAGDSSLYNEAKAILEQASRATAGQSRDSVIEECAKVCERIVLEEGHSATGHGAYLCRKYIRALKSQQDAAIVDSKSAVEASAICQRRASEALSNPAISADSRTAVHAALVCAAVEIAAIESQRSST